MGKQRIGIIGLGAMGLPMARTLADKGFAVTGFDVSAQRRAALTGAVQSLDELAATDIVIMSLPNDEVVKAVAGELMGCLGAGRVIVDTSTVSPETTRGLASAAAAKGIGYVDAPVSGGASGAATGSLLVMAGGAEADVAKARPALDALARKVVVCGGPGAGNVVKLANNMLCAGQLLLAGEALRMAEAGGVTPADLLEALNAGSGRSAVTEVNLPRWILSGAFDSAFSMALMTKDVRLAAALGGSGPLTSEIARRWSTATTDLGGEVDFNRVVEAKIE